MRREVKKKCFLVLYCARSCSRCKCLEIDKASTYLSICQLCDNWGLIIYACEGYACKYVWLYVRIQERMKKCLYVCTCVSIHMFGWMCCIMLLHDVSNINSEDDSGRDVKSVRRLSTIYYNSQTRINPMPFIAWCVWIFYVEDEEYVFGKMNVSCSALSVTYEEQSR